MMMMIAKTIMILPYLMMMTIIIMTSNDDDNANHFKDEDDSRSPSLARAALRHSVSDQVLIQFHIIAVMSMVNYLMMMFII